MAQYYYTDGKERFGPFSEEELKGKNLTGTTLVWKEGMSDWMPLTQVPELQSLLSSSGPSGIPPVIEPIGMPELPPKNWLIESILVTLLCCLPLGIVGIINAGKVESLWNSGQREAALKASLEAAKWVKIGFFVGITLYGLYFLLMVFGVVAGLSGGLPQ